MDGMERIVEMSGAYDKRHSDPKKDYGIHGMDIRFVLKGPLGAVQFVVFTNMHLPHVREERRRYVHEKPFESRFDIDAPMGADIGYHSPTPQYEHQGIAQQDCPYLDGRPCYYDGSGLQAEEFMPTFLSGGSDAVWRMLEQRYADLFMRESAEATP